jgi:amino acid adenylation domain-containing protein
VKGLLHERVTSAAERRPDALAVALDAERLSRGALEEAANRLAQTLRGAGCRRGDRVCLFVPKSPTAVAAMLGVLKADCAYVPIDLQSPAARLARIVAASEPRAVLATAAALPLLDEVAAAGTLEGVVLGSLDEGAGSDRIRPAFTSTDVARAPADAPPGRNGPEDTAHILFTSGSTGAPKGVPISHRNVLAFLDWAIPYFGISEDDRLSGHPPLHFDLSTFDIYGALAAGAELHLVPPSLNLMAAELARFVEDRRLTQWFSVPSVLTYLAKFDAVPDGGFPHLRRVLWCGDVLPTPVLLHWMRRLPHVRFTNLYGPTETTIASSYHTLERPPADETAPIPIGTACAGEELLVLDGALRPVPVGETGDLYVAGEGVSAGYWRDVEKTRAAFVEDPRPGRAGRAYRTGDLARVDDDGNVFFRGRMDSQIKSRGHRIELGEVEGAVNALEGIREAVVVGVPVGGFEGTAIGCAYASTDGGLAPARVRALLRTALPPYMLPSRWLALPELAKNANGKIDRRRVRELFEEQLEPAGVSDRVPPTDSS